VAKKDKAFKEVSWYQSDFVWMKVVPYSIKQKKIEKIAGDGMPSAI
jgi:hypothetical protein